MFKKIEKFFKKKHLDYFFIFLIAFVIFLYLQSPATLPDPDSFYHAKIAELIKKQGVIQSFPWAQFSTLKENYIDHHFLYHLYLVPFTLFFEPLIAIKVATIFLDLILILVFYWFLGHFKIKWRFFWTIILLTINPFLFRISLAKAPALSLIFLILAIYALVNYRHWLLFFLGFFYVWAYGGWPLLWIIVFVYLIVDYFYDKFKKQSIFWQTIQLVISHVHPVKKRKKRIVLFLSLILGTLAGLIINPYFPKNIYFYYQQIYQIAVVNLQKIIGVGGEWYPYSLISLVRDTWILFPVLFIALFIFLINLINYQKQAKLTLVFLLITLFFFIYTLKSRRVVEYFVPFSLLFTSFSFNDYYKTINKINFKINFWLSAKWRQILTIYFFLLILIGGWLVFENVNNVKNNMASGIKLNYFQKAGQWLASQTPQGSIVLHSDWDELPILFYFSDNNYYINGLDQTFMYNYDKNLFWQWVKITQGEKIDDLTTVIKNKFRASYIFIDNDHQAMNNLFKNNPDFKLVYQDQEAKIYQVK